MKNKEISGAKSRVGFRSYAVPDAPASNTQRFMSRWGVRVGIAVTVFSLAFSSFTPATVFAAQAAANLDQCRNGAAASPVDCTGSAWVNGNANATQSHFVEGQSVPYRAILTDLPTGTPITITLGYDVKHSSKHAIDYLTHYDRIPEAVNPISGVAAAAGAPNTFPIPAPSSTGSPVAGQPTASFNALPAGERVMSIWNGAISGMAYVSQGDLNAASAETTISITFTASNSTVVLAWGGHIGSRLDWGSEAGEPRSAGGISGAPYHMRLDSWTLGNLGNTDRALMAGAVAAPTTAGLTLVKNVINDNGGTAAPTAWTLSASGPTPISGTSGSAAVTNAVVTQGTYTLSESGGPAGYTASQYSCVKNGGAPVVGNSITLTATDNAVCTITNNDQAASLTVIKTVVNNNGGTKIAADFTMNVTGTNVSSTSFAGNETGTTVTLNAGAYSVDESVVLAGYAKSIGANCSGTIANGETKTCTITNDDIQPTLTVVKVVDNTNGGTLNVIDFPLFVNANAVVSGNSNNLNAGSYIVTETSAANYTGAFSGDCDLQGAVTLNIGDNKTCTITNTYNRPVPQTGSIIIIKKVIDQYNGGKVAGDFTININATNASKTSTTGSETGETITAEVGAYTITEVIDPNYDVTYSADCTGTVVANQTTTCTITNTAKPAQLIVKKIVINDSGTGQSTEADFNMHVQQNAVDVVTAFAGSTAGTTVDIAAGTYDVTETGPAGYTATYSGDCNASGSVTVTIGATAECTITNDDNAPTDFDVAVTKTVDNASPSVGDSIVYTITATNSGPALATANVLTDVIPAGLTYVSDDGGADTDYDSNTKAITWIVGDLASGASEVLKVTVTVDSGTQGQTITNEASIPVAQNDTNSANNKDDVDLTVNRPSSGGGGGGGGGGSSISNTLAGIKYNDLNRNGVRDNNEPTLAGWVIYLDLNNNDVRDGNEPSYTTAANGAYSFVNITPGTYTVREEMQTGWSQFQPGAAGGSEYSVTVTSMSTINSRDFGNAQGQVLGDVDPEPVVQPQPQPQVQGATDLPRTGMPISAFLMLLAAAGIIIAPGLAMAKSTKEIA